jgi:hypothetical protein
MLAEKATGEKERERERHGEIRVSRRDGWPKYFGYSIAQVYGIPA